MSLLMKALEKAAKDRGDARQKQPEASPARAPSQDTRESAPEPAARAAPPPGTTPIPTPTPPAVPGSSMSMSELSLEPLSPRPPAAPGETKAPPGRVEPAVPPPPPPRERAPETPRAPARQTKEQDRAATVMQASSRPQSGVGAYVRNHPVVMFAGLAGLFAVGFGIYLYLQIFHPGFFVRQAPAPRTAPPLAQAPAPAPAAAPAAAPSGTPPLPLPTAPLLQEPTGAAAPVAAGSAAPAVAPPAAKPPLSEVPPPPPQQPEPAAPRNTIKVSPGTPAPRVDPALTEAYAALTSNRIDAAGKLYEGLLKNDPRSIDAHLGLAAIAVREGRGEDAVERYMKILELDPRNAVAQAGLIALLGRADPMAAESRLKQLISREPSAHLYFVLGNLHADQSQWAQAQHAYFQAYHLEPTNPDYAYNLAVGLEHVSQQKLALGFYQRAVSLAKQRAHVNFDVARAQERIGKLASAAQ